MSYFSDTFNPFIHAQIMTFIPSETLHNHLRRSRILRTSTTRLHITLDLLVREILKLEQRRGVHDSHTVHALDVLGALQSELNLHTQAAATYQKIVTIDDVKEYMTSQLPTRSQLHQSPKPPKRHERNLEAFFNLALQLNKAHKYIEAEIALCRLIPYVRAKHGHNSFQYRNSVEQLMLALHGQGCTESLEELRIEYQRSHDDEAAEMLYTQDFELSDSGTTTYSDYTEVYTDSEITTDLDVGDIETSPLHDDKMPPMVSLQAQENAVKSHPQTLPIANHQVVHQSLHQFDLC